MTEITKKQFDYSTIFRATLYIDDDAVYVVDTYKGDGKVRFIQSFSGSFRDGKDDLNPLGVCASNTISLVIFDEDDLLSPDNNMSPYYGKLHSGTKIVMEATEDGTTWESYGTYYLDSIQGAFSDAYNDTTSIFAHDVVNTISVKQIPKLETYTGTVGDLVVSVFSSIGLTFSDYYIDPKINMSETWGIIGANTVGEFLNSVCQKTFSRVVADRDGRVCIIPSLYERTNANVLNINASETGTFTNKNNQAIDCDKIVVKYLTKKGNKHDTIATLSNIILEPGENTVDNVTFTGKVLSVENVNLEYKNNDNSDITITDMNYEAYQDGMRLVIYCDGEGTAEASLDVKGIVASTTYDEVEGVLGNYGSYRNDYVQEFKVDEIITHEQAVAYTNSLIQYLNSVSRKIAMNDTCLTPKLFPGDRINISGTDTMYDGNFRVTSVEMTISENYNLNLEMVRLI